MKRDEAHDLFELIKSFWPASVSATTGDIREASSLASENHKLFALYEQIDERIGESPEIDPKRTMIAQILNWCLFQKIHAIAKVGGVAVTGSIGVSDVVPGFERAFERRESEYARKKLSARHCG